MNMNMNTYELRKVSPYTKEPWLSLVEVMGEMTTELTRKFRSEGLLPFLDLWGMDVYRTSFRRVPIWQRELKRWADRINLDEMAAEVIWTLDDSAEVHWHDNAYALLTVLGPHEGVAEPEGTIYFKELAIPAVSGITLDVPPGTKHGFSVPSGDPLQGDEPENPIVFLSIQSRKIGDDFHVA